MRWPRGVAWREVPATGARRGTAGPMRRCCRMMISSAACGLRGLARQRGRVWSNEYVSRFQSSGDKERAHFDNAEATSLLSSGGRARTFFQLGVCSASERTTVLICSKRPLALQNCATAKPSFSSFALRSMSEMPRSRSYVPRATTFSRARFERAKP